MTALEIKLSIGAAVLAVALAAFGWYHHKVLLEGEAKIEAADQRASASLKTLTDAQTQHAKELSHQAEMSATHEQKILDDYAIAHPVSSIRMCDQNNSGGRVRQAGSQDSGTQSPAPGSAPVPQVPGRSEGTDLGPAVAVILSAAERLAVIDTEAQQRQP